MTDERLTGAGRALDEYAEIEREPAALAAAHHAFHAALLDDVTGAGRPPGPRAALARRPTATCTC